MTLTSERSKGRAYFRRHFDLSVGEAVAHWNSLPDHAKDHLTMMALDDKAIEDIPDFDMVPPWEYMPGSTRMTSAGAWATERSS